MTKEYRNYVIALLATGIAYVIGWIYVFKNIL